MGGHMYWAMFGSDIKGISCNDFYFLGEEGGHKGRALREWRTFATVILENGSEI